MLLIHYSFLINFYKIIFVIFITSIELSKLFDINNDTKLSKIVNKSNYDNKIRIPKSSTTTTTTKSTTAKINTTTTKILKTFNSTLHHDDINNNNNSESINDEKIEIISYCNDPGRPPKSQISPVQLTYVENERVQYTCDQFISLKQYRKCLKGKWHGDTPLCGEGFRNNDLKQVLIYEAENGFPKRLLKEYNLTNNLQPFNKFGNSFIAERYSQPVRAEGSKDYYWHLIIEKPAFIQMIRISFSIVNHLIDPKMRTNYFDIVSVVTNSNRDCQRVANNSVSPWHFNSTRFDYWYFCRSKSEENFFKEIEQMTNTIRIETTSQIPIKYDLATFILAEQYSNNNNYSDPICGLPEIPVGLEARVINDQINYLYTCAKDFHRVDNYGGQFLTLKCGYDNRWHGHLPTCLPLRKCQKFSLKNDEKHKYLIEVYKYDRVFYLNDDEWIPVKGSRAFFRCKDETNIFVGKEIRICEDGEWTNSLPNCLPTSSVKSDDSLRTSSILIIVLSTLLVTFLLSSCTIYFFLKMRNQQQNLDQQMMQNGSIILPGMELSNTGYYSASSKQMNDEEYESVDNLDDNRYTPYNDLHNVQTPDEQFIEDDYERMNKNISCGNQHQQQQQQQPQQQQTESNYYYDDSNIRPSYLKMR